ncbi:MAG: hypothetical protein ABEI97_01080 [Candidatus Nanohaloarchaea archaeon]
MRRVDVIPEKGRYCTKALRYLLGMDWQETVSRMDEAINNGGDNAYQRGLRYEIERDRVTFDEMRFDGLPTGDGRTAERVIRGEADPVSARDDEEVDAIYAGEDLVVETALEDGYDPENWDGIGDTAASYLSGYGFEREERLEPDISWTPMERGGITEEPGTVLLPAGWENLGTLVARDRFDQDPDIRSIPENADEESYIAESGETGIYMYDSGETADDANLAYIDPVPDRWKSRLGVFETEDPVQVYWPRRYDGFR